MNIQYEVSRLNNSYPTIPPPKRSPSPILNLNLNNLVIPETNPNNIDLSNLNLDTYSQNKNTSIDLNNINLDNIYTDMKITTFEYAFIITRLRGQSIMASDKASDLKTYCGKIDSKEYDKILLLRKYITCYESYDLKNYPFFNDHTPGSLVIYLGSKTKHTYPIPTKFSTKKEYILAYYTYMGFDVWPKQINFNDQQLYLLNPNIQGIHVINAGPGTGKTTIANNRALLLKGDGVLLISYTNEAINENYNRLKSKANMRGKLVKKKYEKNKDIINVSTVDSLATHICQSGSNSTNFDLNIINATKICQSNLSNKIKRYSHIIVDEAQDIDDIRGYLIMMYFVYSGAKSICIFGDPRQRIHEKHGNWYTKLWIDQSYGTYKVTRIGFAYTYRFQNRLHIEIANKLSARRPEIDCPLQSDPSVPVVESKKIKLYSSISDDLDENIRVVAGYIQNELHKKMNVTYGEIAVIDQSMNKDNATYDLVGKICAVFKDMGLKCYTSSGGSFIPNAIYFGTIHDVKGKEFDHVFMFGSNSFPETFNIIPYNSAESLIYVMHTRARKQMYYISPKQRMFTPPRGLRPYQDEKLYISDPELLDNKPFLKKEDFDRFYGIADLSTEFSFDRFLETNEYDIVIEPWFSLHSKIPKRPEEINARFWGIFCSFCVQLLMTNKYHNVFNLFIKKQYKIIGDGEYINKTRTGNIVNGVDISSGILMLKQGLVNILRDYELETLSLIIQKPPNELVIGEYVFLSKIYDFLINGHTQSRYDIDSYNNDKILDAFKDLAKGIESSFGDCIDVEYLTSNRYMNIIGAIDSLHEDHILEFKTVERNLSKTDAYQAMMYSLCTGKQPILINLQNGKVFQIRSREKNIRWYYIIKSYTNLRTHIDAVISRKNTEIGGSTKQNIPINKNMFVVDTEFVVGFRSTAYIFEIAMINLIDPYRSIVQTVNPGNKYLQAAVDHLHESIDLFKESKTIMDIKNMFIRLLKVIGVSDAQLMYYVCNYDVSWWYNDTTPNNSIDLSQKIKDDAKELGFINLGSAPPLSEYYNIKCLPVQTQPHLNVHTAMTDSLLLYEMLHLNKIP